MIDIKVENRERVVLKLMRKYPQATSKAQRESMEKSMREIEGALRTDALQSRYQGSFSDHIGSKIYGKAGDSRFIGKVGSSSNIGHLVEYGRGPGKFPNLDILREWVETKFNGTDRDVYLIGRKIQNQGTLINKRRGYETGWAHLRTVVKLKESKVKTMWKDSIERAIRLVD